MKNSPFKAEIFLVINLAIAMSMLINPRLSEIYSIIIVLYGMYKIMAKKNSDGAAHVFAAYTYPETEFKKNKFAIEEFEKQLKDEMKIEIITSPQEMMFPDSLFFDTVYHLNEEGRRLRTEIVIANMRKVL